MTYSQTQAVAAAKRDVGFYEGPNNRNPYSWWQYFDWTAPYCASAVSMWSYEAGYRFRNYDYGEKGDANCTRFRQHAMRDGIWSWGHSIRAQPGDLVIETFGIPDQHIEMVVQDDGGSSVLTIGGNTGNGVFYRVRKKNCVVGYIRLRDGGQSGPGNVPGQPPQPPKPPPPILHGGSDVKPTDPTFAGAYKNGGLIALHADGGVFVEVPGGFYGSLPGDKGFVPLKMGVNHATSLLLTPSEQGYNILKFDGAVHSYGDASYDGNFYEPFKNLKKLAPKAVLVSLVRVGNIYKAIADVGNNKDLVTLDPKK